MNTLRAGWIITLRDLAHWVRQPWTPIFGLLFTIMLLLVFGFLSLLGLEWDNPGTLGPLGVGEILDGAISTIRAHPKVMLGLSAVVAVAAQLISRHWVITDAAGGIQEVKGLGVVGHRARDRVGDGVVLGVDRGALSTPGEGGGDEGVRALARVGRQVGVLDPLEQARELPHRERAAQRTGRELEHRRAVGPARGQHEVGHLDVAGGQLASAERGHVGVRGQRAELGARERVHLGADDGAGAPAGHVEPGGPPRTQAHLEQRADVEARER